MPGSSRPDTFRRWTPGARTSATPISRKRPPRGRSRSDASTNSPVSELRTTSTPSPSVADRISSRSSASRELAMCLASNPILSSTGHLPALAVPYTSAPKCRHSCTAAIPTPPAAACTRTRSPALTCPSSCSAYNAVRYASGTVAASSNDIPAGIFATSCAAVTARVPKHPSPNPNTRSPTDNRRHIRADRFHHTGKLEPDAR